MALHIIDHPLVLHKLSLMRDKETSTMKFRELLKEIAMLMGYEITRDFPLTYEEIETPLQKMQAPKIAGKKVVIAPILRAGLGMVEGLATLIPSRRGDLLARVLLLQNARKQGSTGDCYRPDAGYWR